MGTEQAVGCWVSGCGGCGCGGASHPSWAGLWPLLQLWLTPYLLCSGLTHEAHRKEVEQVYLRCAAGSVEWMYPTGALIVNLRPNTFSPSRGLTVCIKPFSGSSGANVYLERTGELRLLVPDGSGPGGRVQCFSLEQGGLFVEATPQQDISRRTTGFQYELMSGRRGLGHALSGEWARERRDWGLMLLLDVPCSPLPSPQTLGGTPARPRGLESPTSPLYTGLLGGVGGGGTPRLNHP